MVMVVKKQEGLPFFQQIGEHLRKTFDGESIVYHGQPPKLGQLLDRLVFVDTETSGLHPDDGARISAVSLAWRTEQPHTIHTGVWFFDQGDPLKSRNDGEDVWNAILNTLSEAHLVFHNAKFDLHMLRAGTKTGYDGIDLVDRVLTDTMVWAHEVSPVKSAALKPTAVDLWGEDADAEKKALAPFLKTKADPRYDLVPPEVIYPYAAMDTVYTLKLFEEFQRWRDEGTNTAPELDFEVRLMKRLYAMERAGLPYNPKLSRRCAKACEQRQNKLEDAFPVEPRLAKKWYFSKEPFESRGSEVVPLGLPPVELTPSGAPSMTKQVLGLMSLEPDRYPHADELDLINFYKRARSIWFEPYANRTGADNRIRGSFRQVASGYSVAGGTVSGRYSIERVNLQAVPHDGKLRDKLRDIPTVRDIIKKEVSRYDGYTIIEADLAQAELRIAALYAECDLMLDAIRNGDDLHGVTARRLFNVTPDSPDWAAKRQIAKRANFSLIFGAGARAFSTMLFNETGRPFPVYEAGEIVDAWRSLYPQFSESISYWETYAQRKGFVPIADHRRRWFKKDEPVTKAFNQVVQASLAQLSKKWLDNTAEAMVSLGFGDPVDFKYKVKRGSSLEFVPRRGYAGLIMVVHDSQMLLVPKDRVEEIGNIVVDCALREWDRLFPGIPGGVDFKAW